MNIIQFKIGFNHFSDIVRNNNDIRTVILTNVMIGLLNHYSYCDEQQEIIEQWIALLDGKHANLDHITIKEKINILRLIVEYIAKSFGDDYDQSIYISFQSNNLTYTVDAFVEQGIIKFSNK